MEHNSRLQKKRAKEKLNGLQKKKEYLVQVTIIEARNLSAKDGSGTSDPFIKITVGNLKPQITDIKQEANTVVFNQNFTFDELKMNNTELENFEILIECYDFNQFMPNELIGLHSIGLGSLYRCVNRELYQTWLPLIHPLKGLEPQGHLQVNCYIVGPNDRPPKHDANEVKQDEEEDDEFKDIPEDQLTVEQQIARKERKEKLNIIGVPKILGQKGHQLLINIVKAEDLVIMTMGSIDPFLSVRAGGNVLKTAVEEKAQKPSFKTRMMFPVYFPVHNEKVVIRLWDRRKFWSDIFVAQIPENPNSSDFFNLNFLKAQGGIMGYRWFNIYGVPYTERSSNWDKIVGNQQSIQGTQYLGRVLLSMSLSESEKPQLGVQQLGAYREPQIAKYELRVDIFEIQGSNDFGKQVLIKIKVGGVEFKSKWADLQTNTFQNQKQVKKKKKDEKNDKKNPQNEKKSYNYVFKDSRIQIPEEKLDLPQVIEQQPDIIISIYERQNQEERLAYIRIKRSCKDLESNDPNWYPLKGCQPGQTINSFALLNVSLLTAYEAKMVPRPLFKRSTKIKYKFIASLYAGYDILSDKEQDEIQVGVDIQLGGELINFDYYAKGSNPIWNSTQQQIVYLDEKLEFAQNIIIQFRNKKQKNSGFWDKVRNIFTGDQDHEQIGENIIKSNEIRTDILYGTPEYKDFQYKYQFYHIKQKGMSKGRILAAFHLFPIDKNTQMDYDQENLNPPIQHYDKVLLEFPIIGIRNLIEKMENPLIKIRIAQPLNLQLEDIKLKELQNKKKSDDYTDNIDIEQNKKKEMNQNLGYWYKEVTLDQNQKNVQDITRDPTYCKIVTNLIIPEDQEDQDNENNIYGSQSEKQKINKDKIITEPIYVPCGQNSNLFMPQMQIEIIDDIQTGIKKYIMLDKYVTSINLQQFISWEQDQVHLLDTFEYFQDNIELDDIDDFDLDLESQENSEQENSDIQSQQKSISQNSMPDDMQEQTDNDKKLNSPRISESQPNSTQNKQQLQSKKIKNQGKKDYEQILDHNDIDLTEASNLKQENIQKFNNPNKFKNHHDLKSNQSYKSHQTTSFSLNSQKYYQQEIQIAIKKIKNFNSKFEKVLTFSKTQFDKDKETDEIQKKKSRILQILQKVTGSTKTDEEIKLKLKKDIKQLQEQEITEDQFLESDDLASGNEGFNYGDREILKENFEEIHQKDLPYLKFYLYKVSGTYQNGILGELSQSFIKAHVKLTLLDQQDNIREEIYQSHGHSLALVKYKSPLDTDKFKFDLFQQQFLDFFQSYESLTLKTRVYILRCQNLGAQSQKIQFKQYLAGDQAKCSADPYPTIKVGDGINKGKDFIKNVNNPSHKKENTLDPQFYQMYELDAQLPMDLRLNVEIKNAGLIGDSLIGGFEIDLEERLVALKPIRQRIILKIMEEQVDDQLDEIKFNYDKESKEKKTILQSQKNDINAQYESLKAQVRPPVEYQELLHPDKKTCQGTAELVIEPFFEELAQQNQPQHFEPPKPQLFEIRLIVWETSNVYINPEKKVVDIYVKVSIEGEATGTGEQITLETDTHNGSEDGKGQFNYRMKFPLMLPTNFARLRVQIYDFSVLGSSDLCGETTISLKKVIGKLRTEGIYEMLPTDFSVEHPNMKGKERGIVSLQMKIIQKEAADRDPVGNGQDEPNNDPVLVKPTEGRGIGDFIKGGGFGFGRIMFIIKVLVAVCAFAVMIMILFINPGILVN